MSLSPVISTTVLGKRKATRYILHLSASPQPEPSTSTTVNDTPRPASKKARHPCTYSGCTKSYSKACRLAEHIRSHTGERPYVCLTCQKSYLRESHLQAHAKSHLPESERPYVCTESATCQKRFWTFQHLQVHENTHSGAKCYACSVEGCDEVFAKHHQLRSHTCEAHAPPGTKPYMCTHPGCTKSFDTNQKLRGHLKTHDDKRYTCAHPNCLPSSNTDPIYYPTWTSLQAHIRDAHPPTCMHPSCDGRTFASQHNLRAHQKLHEQQDLEAVLAGAELSDAADSPRKRRRGGEVGRDWKCDKCGKEFKSIRALTTHNNVIHLGHRNHVCPHQYCSSAFGYKHLLERHLAKIHSTMSDQSVAETSESEGDMTTDTDGPDNDLPDSAAHLSIDRITGQAYSLRSRMPTSKTVRCPYPDIEGLLLLSPDPPLSSSSVRCEHILTRAYDLRRHLKAEHGLVGDKSKVDSWVKSHRGVD
ncbi:uncharacterized protein EDB91DRAFT_339426 [Suillus paluster]|uniref:uncharacterized protein n=1 Tax=Suillus paluster TaxID=48578 RepID=UPI001B86CB79|nr:uncharacterized protein EDB91DRAFT_339426 [Suillus paluster]KAG1740797.1 hypothetical protein EDB91DRAFT_339426 [Suillus paluster]